VTPAGCGTRLHFDANANFIVQLHGTKRWELAPNTSVLNPTERFTTGAHEMPAALEKQCHAPLLNDLPSEGCVEFFMEPGCFLYVPRGYWHTTTTDEDSISLNFTFSQPTWADILTKSLQELLLNSPEWRELADGLDSKDLERKKNALSRFNTLVKQLSKELPELSGTELIHQSGLLKNNT
jgi:50S ribosomal protein L16 3-hydroxylase